VRAVPSVVQEVCTGEHAATDTVAAPTSVSLRGPHRQWRLAAAVDGAAEDGVMASCDFRWC
jgi:hypothetical protein